MKKQVVSYNDEVIKLLYLYDENLFDKDSILRGNFENFVLFDDIKPYFERKNVSKKDLDKDKKIVIGFLKDKYYDKYVVKEKDIPVEYLLRKKRVLEQRGVRFSRKKEISKIINCQKKSFDKWIDFLVSSSCDYPMEVILWAFSGMVKLGLYNYEKHSFSGRNKNSTCSFAEFDKDALCKSLDLITMYYPDMNVTDFSLLNDRGNFGKIYAKFLWDKELSVSNKSSLSSDGIWKKYAQGSDYLKMQRAIDGKFTFWYIDDERVAEDYLSTGDVYIYYTKDVDGNYTMPRIFIATEFDEVMEIRGISDTNQNVESILLDVLEEKLLRLKHGKKFDTILTDMKLISNIVNKINDDGRLTNEELDFIYEKDRLINYFGVAEDVEITEFKMKQK